MSKTLSQLLILGVALLIVAFSYVNLVFAFDTLIVSPIQGPANTPSALIKFGIGTSTPYAALSILGKHTDSDVTSPFVAIASSTATATTTLFKIGRSGLVTNGGIKPTVATSSGSGSGSVPVIIGGAPNFINLNVITGATPAQNALIATVTMPESCPTATVPVIGNANALARATSSSAVYASSTGATTFDIVSGNVALIASSNYIWNVRIGCY